MCHKRCFWNGPKRGQIENDSENDVFRVVFECYFLFFCLFGSFFFEIEGEGFCFAHGGGEFER